VWPDRHRRIQRLENEIAEARAGQAELRRRVEVFEQIAAAAGADLGEQTVDFGKPVAAHVPPPLLAAAQDPRRDAPVRLDVNGREMIAVVGGEDGDPERWWTAIQDLASRPRSAL
jgi:hypothetical protein